MHITHTSFSARILSSIINKQKIRLLYKEIEILPQTLIF